MSLKFFALFSLIILVSSCASTPPSWPDSLPAVSTFQTNWKADAANQEIQSQDEYLLWVQRFYEGYNTVPGWFDLTTRVLASVPDNDRATVTEQLSALSLRISGEWAKDNSVRRIDTSTVATWRDALQESLSRMELNAYLARLNQDIDSLLAGELSTDDISFERYYTDEFDL
ncbi:MAG: hypothetical protein V4628_06585 [Pseudomonadota bacterium]